MIVVFGIGGIVSLFRMMHSEAKADYLELALEERRIEEEKEKEELELEKAERQARIAAIPGFVDLGDTLNYTDENDLRQGIWEERAEGLDEFSITPMGESEPLKLDGMVMCRMQYRNDTLHGFYQSYDIFNGGRLCAQGLYIMGEKDGEWKYPCASSDTMHESVYD